MMQSYGYLWTISLLLNQVLVPHLMKSINYPTSSSCGLVNTCSLLSDILAINFFFFFFPSNCNKLTLICVTGTKSSNLLRYLHKGFLPAACSIPVPGYMVLEFLNFKIEGLLMLKDMF